MTELQWLLSASAAIWLGLGAYLFFLACKQQELSRRVARMENEYHD